MVVDHGDVVAFDTDVDEILSLVSDKLYLYLLIYIK